MAASRCVPTDCAFSLEHGDSQRSGEDDGIHLVLSVVVPAYNEGRYLPKTLQALRRSAAAMEARSQAGCEIVVVDDGSTDDTCILASRLADHVLSGGRRGIGWARNLGADAISGSLVVFIDADTIVQEGVLSSIYEAWKSGVQAGGVRAVYESNRWIVRALFALWRWYVKRDLMTQGVCQFFDRKLFTELGGYRTDLFMAEDTDLNARALKLLRERGIEHRFQVIDTVQVHPSLRRYEQWKSWRILLWTNPWTTKFARGSRWVWRGWYDNPPR